MNQGALSPLLFNFSLKICHYKGPRKAGVIGIQWDTSISGLCWWC